MQAKKANVNYSKRSHCACANVRRVIPNLAPVCRPTVHIIHTGIIIAVCSTNLPDLTLPGPEPARRLRPSPGPGYLH
ncbi:uncharacterized protein LMH87_009028 [Akanthomyces muscarius]|uniref:Uncharacterized protein n=1 Tax=Akanthomyces muscarius TaxID=2231603 RepID=A0A9W8QKW6_AKAMU|nr:uncharacterized protein LMH87_009028 [Akanthomyces muscarius]KAJ4158505.1 hypothetical protein LMH87_009028 [Akanthomyces muscarius]